MSENVLTLSVFEAGPPKVNECAVRSLDLRPRPGCRKPGLDAEIFHSIMSYANLNYRVIRENFESENISSLTEVDLHTYTPDMVAKSRNELTFSNPVLPATKYLAYRLPVGALMSGPIQILQRFQFDGVVVRILYDFHEFSCRKFGKFLHSTTGKEIWMEILRVFVPESVGGNSYFIKDRELLACNAWAVLNSHNWHVSMSPISGIAVFTASSPVQFFGRNSESH